MDDVLPITQPPVRQLLLQESNEISSSASAADLLDVKSVVVVTKAEMIASEKTDILVADHYYLIESENCYAVGIPLAVHYYFGAFEEQPV